MPSCSNPLAIVIKPKASEIAILFYIMQKYTENKDHKLNEAALAPTSKVLSSSKFLVLITQNLIMTLIWENCCLEFRENQPAG
jgi:hypothetical protein